MILSPLFLFTQEIDGNTGIHFEKLNHEYYYGFTNVIKLDSNLYFEYNSVGLYFKTDANYMKDTIYSLPLFPIILSAGFITYGMIEFFTDYHEHLIWHWKHDNYYYYLRLPLIILSGITNGQFYYDALDIKYSKNFGSDLLPFVKSKFDVYTATNKINHFWWSYKPTAGLECMFKYKNYSIPVSLGYTYVTDIVENRVKHNWQMYIGITF